MKSILIKVALFAINKLLRGVEKLLQKKPNSSVLLKTREDLLQAKQALLNVKFN